MCNCLLFFMLNFSADSLLCSSDSEVGDQNFASRLWAHENRDEENRQANHRPDEDRARQGDLLAPSVFISFLARALLGIGMGAEWPDDLDHWWRLAADPVGEPTIGGCRR